MKKIIVLFSAVVMMASCANKDNGAESANGTGNFGTKIDEAGAVPVAEMITAMNGQPEMEAKVEGKIMECCQKKGCWMDIDKGDGTPMKVTFKDYGFFVPKDAGGKTAIFHGRAYLDTIPVETLKHYAEDAGKSKEEIEKITEPKTEVAFEADGVIIK